jgi:REP element-mobilizing transposase RayT
MGCHARNQRRAQRPLSNIRDPPLREVNCIAYYQSVAAPLDSAQSSAQSRERQRAAPGTYLITFACYGARLHGELGTVDLRHNIPGTPRLPRDSVRLALQSQRMVQPPYALDQTRRSVTLNAIRELCDQKSWTLLAAHVRTNHVHTVVQAEATPEWVMSSFKRVASRALNELSLDDKDDYRRWARHGSTRYIWTKEQLSAAIRYTVSGQGEPMTVYEAP